MYVCVSPLKGFQVGVNPSGKPQYKIVPYKVHHIEKHGSAFRNCFDAFVSPSADCVIREGIDIPCGKCVECRLGYARMWSDRMMLEAQKWQHNYFVTLTYDDENLPFSETGLMTLKPKHLQDFMKRLRKRFEPDIIRFYAAGEYGDSTKRPHYHLILFNCDIPDLVYYKTSPKGEIYYNSEIMSKLWPFGYAVIGSVSKQSCGYVARYVMKKQKGFTKDLYNEIGIEPEFVRMSRRPGIARDYFDENYQDIYKCDEIIYSDVKGGYKSKPPRYFDKCLEQIDETLYKFVKDSRKTAMEYAKKLLCIQTKLTYEEILNNRGRNLEKKALILQRIL